MSRRDDINEQTRIRHALLDNGYTPLANKTKDCLLKGWSHLEVTHELIDEWSGMLGYRATGVRIGGGLVMIDFDIDDADVIEDVVDSLPDDLWDILRQCPVRHGGGQKEAWFARLNGPDFYRIASTAYSRPGDSDEVLHRLEVFAGSGRQAGVYGAHTLDTSGDVAVAYRWADKSLVDVPFAELPVVSEVQIVRLCDAVNAVMEARGWVPCTRSKAGKTVETEIYDLTSDMVFETRDHGDLNLSELEAACVDGQVRLSASWLEGPAARNLTRCIATLHPGDGRLRVLETANFTMHRPADMNVQSSANRLGELMVARGWLAEDGETGERVDIEAYREEWLEADEDDRPRVFVKVGDLAVAARVTARAMTKSDRFYDYGGRPAVVIPGSSRVEIMDEHRLANEVGHAFRFLRPAKPAKEGEEQAEPTPIDPPMALVKQVISLGEARGLKPLAGVVDTPIMRTDGSIVDVPGYDERTRLLVRCSAWGSINENPSDAEIDAAIETLWAPLASFPFVGSEARGGAFAALLTAALRRTLPTAPAFAFDAPTQGSGKTLLAQTIGALAGGVKMMTPLPLRNEEEVAKTLLSVLSQNPRGVVFDNQIGIVDSASLATVLTSPVYEGRVLGSSATVAAPTNCLVMLTGNNITLGGDMPRRTVSVRIDAQTETPFARVFDFNPLEIVKTRRLAMVSAALTLVKAAFRSSEPGRIGSFEDWDRLVAQTVRWMDDERFADPMGLIVSAHENDPTRDEALELMEALYGLFGEARFTARDIVDKINMHAAHTGPIKEFLDGMNVKHTTKSVGRVLRFREGQRVGGYHLSVTDMGNKRANTYAVRREDEASEKVVSLKTV